MHDGLLIKLNMTMSKKEIVLLVFLVSLVTAMVVYPVALSIARRFQIVDNPSARKLQRVPVPVFGGVVVYSGILAGWLVLMLFMESPELSWGLGFLAVMMLLGTWDDMKDIPATFRFLIEFLLVGAFIAITGIYIDSLHGLWGVYGLEPWVGVTLSLVLGVGIINAVNMIDGVDGYSSGYGMLFCTCLALLYSQVWAPVITCLSVLVIGSILPFFLHNVFGRKSKMFIGDGGTLMLGMLMVILSFYVLSSKYHDLEWLVEKNLGVTAFMLAVGSIPLFDTLRVMFMRVVRGVSPFRADKTHLHHLFIDMGFSHLGAAFFILMMNAGVVLVWLLAWQLGASVDMQMYIVMLLGLGVTFLFYKVMKIQQNGGPLDEDGYPQGTKLWHVMVKLGESTRRENKPFWRFMQHLMDGPLMGLPTKRRRHE